MFIQGENGKEHCSRNFWKCCTFEVFQLLKGIICIVIIYKRDVSAEFHDKSLLM